MERTNLLLTSLSCLLLLQACKKEETSPVPGPIAASSLGDISEFSNLRIGNYWIYDHYKVDENDNILETVRTDSVWVAGDSVINGVTYKVVNYAAAGNPGPVFNAWLWRDSANHLLQSWNSEPDLLFSTGPLDQVIYTRTNEAGITWEYTVLPGPVEITVPAGTFSTYLLDQPITDFNIHPVQAEWKRFRSYWSRGIGRVRYYRFFANDPLGMRYDLVRYNVE